MRVIFIFQFLVVFVIQAFAQLRVEPPSWFYDINKDSIQLLLHAEDLQSFSLEIDGPMELLSTAKMEHNNYLLLNVVLRADKRDSVEIRLKKGLKTLCYIFQIQESAKKHFEINNTEKMMDLWSH